MKDESMVEVLARAICDAFKKDNPRAYISPMEKPSYIDYCDGEPPDRLGGTLIDGHFDMEAIARACLQALLDHAEDEEMLKAGELAVSRLWEPADSTVAYAAFRAMISKALGK